MGAPHQRSADPAGLPGLGPERREERKRLGKQFSPPSLSRSDYLASFSSQDGRALCLHHGSGLRAHQAQAAGIQSGPEGSLPEGGPWNSALFPLDLPAAACVPESSGGWARPSVQVSQHLRWKRWMEPALPLLALLSVVSL